MASVREPHPIAGLERARFHGILEHEGDESRAARSRERPIHSCDPHPAEKCVFAHFGLRGARRQSREDDGNAVHPALVDEQRRFHLELHRYLTEGAFRSIQRAKAAPNFRQRSSTPSRATLPAASKILSAPLMYISGCCKQGMSRKTSICRK